MPGRLGFLNFPFLSTLSLRRATLSGSSRATVLVFLSTLSLRRATSARPHFSAARIFLSTLSLRRATRGISSKTAEIVNFYPRSPCGERRVEPFHATARLYFYPRSPCGERPWSQAQARPQSCISIHALLAESDWKRFPPMCTIRHFYPRSPCGERHTDSETCSSVPYFYPRSPCGERPMLNA